MEVRTEAEIIDDMERIIFTRAHNAELSVIRNRSEGNIYVWNEYKSLLKRLDLLDEYLEVYND